MPKRKEALRAHIPKDPVKQALELLNILYPDKVQVEIAKQILMDKGSLFGIKNGKTPHLKK